MERFKEKITIENILCIYVIMCPFLDMASFLFRNIFQTSLSPSTFIRPIIPICVIIYMFFKKDAKFKIKTILIAVIYLLYSVIHIYIFSKTKTLCSYSNEVQELQYLVNYSFMILNLYLYITTFNKNNIEKLRKSVLISAGIYIISIFIAIITNTSSSTYIEQMGLKGWFESGNTVCAILLLSIYAYIPLIKQKGYRIVTFIITVLIGIFLSMLVGTRVGLYGFIITIAIFIFTEIIQGLVTNKKMNKKILIIGTISLIAVVGAVVIFGSNTLQRRKHLQEIEEDIVDETKNDLSHITGSLLEIKEKIDKNELEEGYMSEAQKQSIKELYNIANDMQIKNNDQRMQQLIYNFILVKNQANPMLMLFGNGYMVNYRELVFEMEVPAILLNFGIIGFMLYLAPFIAILLKSLSEWIKQKKKYDSEYVRLFLGCGFAFALSLLSGYTFFNQSSALIIVVLYTMLKKR